MPIQRKNWVMSALSRKTSMNPLIAILEALHFHQLQSLMPIERSLILKSKGKFSALHCSFNTDAEFALRLEPQNPQTKKQYGEVKALYEKASCGFEVFFLTFIVRFIHLLSRHIQRSAHRLKYALLMELTELVKLASDSICPAGTM
ncbi:hypothetical protein KY285_023507 [Solanum tuberosum]|nr:hypothetical protein KY289_023839 [Solanum tuberosum]KAH0675706.1 hypothetical protein KY285_023507 [Solanum tuberosum]